MIYEYGLSVKNADFPCIHYYFFKSPYSGYLFKISILFRTGNYIAYK